MQPQSSRHAASVPACSFSPLLAWTSWRCPVQVLARRLRLEGNFDFRAVAKRTPGYVGADLAALMKEAAAVAVSRIFTRLEAARVASAAAAAAAAPATASAGLSTPAAGAVASDTAGKPEEAVKADNATEAGADKESAAAVAEAAAQLEPQANGPAAGADAEMTEAEVAQAAGAALLAADVAAFSGAGFGLGPLGPAELAGLAITMSDFEAALPKVQPSVRREGFTTTPDVTWDDVGALAEVRARLRGGMRRTGGDPKQISMVWLSKEVVASTVTRAPSYVRPSMPSTPCRRCARSCHSR